MKQQQGCGGEVRCGGWEGRSEKEASEQPEILSYGQVPALPQKVRVPLRRGVLWLFTDSTDSVHPESPGGAVTPRGQGAEIQNQVSDDYY